MFDTRRGELLMVLLGGRTVEDDGGEMGGVVGGLEDFVGSCLAGFHNNFELAGNWAREIF